MRISNLTQRFLLEKVSSCHAITLRSVNLRNFSSIILKDLGLDGWSVRHSPFFPTYDGGNFDGNPGRGRIFTYEGASCSGDGWEYLNGTGDFRTSELVKLRDEADMVVTNPPFSLFREFMSWLLAAPVQFIILGNMNAITYKEVFPAIMANRVWLGATNFNTGIYFRVPDNFVHATSYRFKRQMEGEKVTRVSGVCWFTNVTHGRRLEPLPLMSEAQVIELISRQPFKRYDNYDAIEVPKISQIPGDFSGVMGVPISFLDRYCPDQFEIVGSNRGIDQDPAGVFGRGSYLNGSETYKRLFIRNRCLKSKE